MGLIRSWIREKWATLGAGWHKVMRDHLSAFQSLARELEQVTAELEQATDLDPMVMS